MTRRTWVGWFAPLLALALGVGLLTITSSAAYTGSVNEAGSWSTTSQDYGCALGGTVVKSVQQGTFTLGGGTYGSPVTLTTTATITAVDTSKAFLLFDVSSPGSGIVPGAINVRGDLTSSTVVTFTRTTSETNPVIMNGAFSVVEYACGVTVQRGAVTVSSAVQDVTIAAVGSTARAFVLWSKTAAAADTAWRGDDTATVELTSTTNVRVTAGPTPTGHVVAWQVVEFTVAGAAQVQRGTTAAFNDTSTLGTSVGLGQNAPLESSFVLVDSVSAGAATSDAARIVSGHLASPSSITLSRGSAAWAVTTVSWQVVSLNEGSYVQTGQLDLTAGTHYPSWNATDSGRTTVISAAQMGFGQGAAALAGTVNGIATAQAKLTNSSTFATVDRQATGYTATIDLQRIEWGGPSTTWNATYGLRRRVVVSATNSGGLPAGYSVPVVFDHAAAVSAGFSLGSGDDVRIAYFDGSTWTPLDRVLGDGSTWNSSTTTLWFKTSTAIAASANSGLATDGEYWLYYGNRSAASPPATADNVYLVADGFESGSLSRWNQLIGSGYFTVTSTRARSGTKSLAFGSTSATYKTLAANGVNEAGVSIDAYVYMAGTYTSNMVGIGARDTTTSISDVRNHGTGFRNSGGVGWDIASFNGGIGAFVEQSNSAGQTNTGDAWFKITFQMQPGSGTTTPNAIRVLKNGVALNPTSGWTSVTPVAAGGTVGFTAYNVPVSGSVDVDDFVARKLVIPEPTVSISASARN